MMDSTSMDAGRAEKEKNKKTMKKSPDCSQKEAKAQQQSHESYRLASCAEVGIALVTMASGLGSIEDFASFQQERDHRPDTHTLGNIVWDYLDARLDVMRMGADGLLVTEDVRDWTNERRQKVSVLRGKKKRGRDATKGVLCHTLDVLLPSLEEMYGTELALPLTSTGSSRPAIPESHQSHHNSGNTDPWVCSESSSSSSSSSPSPSLTTTATPLSQPQRSAQSPPNRGAHQNQRIVRHVTKGTCLLPPLELLQLEDTLRERYYLTGPVIFGGVISVADFTLYAILHAFMPLFLRDDVAKEIPNLCRFVKNMQRIEEVAQLLPPHDVGALASPSIDEDTGPLGKAVQVVIGKGTRRKQQRPANDRRVANDSYTLEPVWFGNNKAEYKEQGSWHTQEAKKRRQKALPGYVASACSLLLHTIPFNQLASRCRDEQVYQEGMERIEALWAGEMGHLLDPTAGSLNVKRAQSKRTQIEFLCKSTALLARPGDIIVEFGAGGGHVGLCLAYCFPMCQVLLLERNLFHVTRAHARIRKTGLTNIECIVGDMGDFSKIPFHIGVGSHFCGYLTDLAMDVCFRQKASFVFCPCCYGKITHNIVPDGPQTDGKPVKYKRIRQFPKSERFRQAHIAEKEFFYIASGADDEDTPSDVLTRPLTVVKTAEEGDSEGSCAKRIDEAQEGDDKSALCADLASRYPQLGRICMGIVDTDRVNYAQEQGYETLMSQLEPASCTPKNHLLIAWGPA